MKSKIHQLLAALSFVVTLGAAKADPAEFFPFGPSDAFDLANSTVVFTPSGVSTYDVCIDPAFNYPVSPNTHTTIALGDDDSRTVALQSGSVILYGTSYSELHIGSNGYITFGNNNADTQIRDSLAGHYLVPRVSALSMDLDPNSAGTISYKELADRFVVTFQEVQQAFEPLRRNSFQYELFFDGRIAITWLAIGSPEAEMVVGLSDGNGVPAAFVETDFSAAPVCTLPNNLSVLPLDPMVSRGFPGGSKFSPQTKTYDLENVGATALDWTAAVSEPWATVSPASGTLQSGATVSLVVTLNAPMLGALPAGLSSADLTITNVTASASEGRGVYVHAGVVDHLSEVFDSNNPFDLAGEMIVFTPEGSANGYAVVREQLGVSLPTDPDGGRVLNLTTGTATREIRLCGGRTLPFFGVDYDRFHINNHGNLTFTAADGVSSALAADHFSLPRVSALFGGIAYAEFAPGTKISWKELADRVAVTWDTGFVSAQAELFYSGVIRLSWHGSFIGDAVSGLSRGNGLPADFSVNVSRLNAYGECPDADELSVSPDTHLFKSAGPPKGPFLPASKFYTLANSDPAFEAFFRITSDESWVQPVIRKGALGPLGSLPVSVQIDQAAAALLAPGTHVATLTFENTTTGVKFLRGVCLKIDQTDFLTEVFEDDFDLAAKSMTFTPNGSRDFYDITLKEIVALPENNAAHTPIGFSTSIVSQQSEKVALGGGKRVWLYGSSFSEVNVSNHGWVKFGNEAINHTLDAHFSHPAVSVCRTIFNELQHSSGRITSHQDDTAGKLTITWQDLAMPGHADFNSFQLEMFYDGRIRMSWLGMNLAEDSIEKIVGLSRGRGNSSTPPDFFESDLSGLANQLEISGPTEYFARGTVGNAGSFAPSSAVYTLHNTGFGPVTWAASVGSTFLDVSPSGGTLQANDSVTLTLSPNATNVAGLPEGWHRDVLVMEDQTNGCATVREATVLAGTQSDFFAQEWYPTAQGVSADFCVPLHPLAPDNAEPTLEASTITLVPDGSANFYSATRTSGVAAFPTSPTAGTPLAQEGIVYKLSGTNTVQLYGKHYANFRRAWESGAVTFNTMLDEPVQSGEFTNPVNTLERYMVPSMEEHVAQPTIAPLLTTLAGAQMEARELSDRVVITWVDAVNFTIGFNFDRCFAAGGMFNSLQVEMFFNGVIRYTILSSEVDGGRNFNLVSGISGGEKISAGATTSPTNFDLLPAPSALELDFGDLGGNYRTLSADGGPQHTITPLIQLGATAPDAELDGNPSPAATGDDGHDEDALMAVPVLVRGQAAAVQVGVLNELMPAQSAELSVFIDWNADGDFDDTDEEVGRSSISTTVGVQTEIVNFTVPTDAALLTDLGLRIRFSTQTGLGAFGAAADGEVEDYLVQVEPPMLLDYGDLTNIYLTKKAQNGARHVASGDLFIGATAPDAEADGVPSALADGDGVDEDTSFIWQPLFPQPGAFVFASVQFDVTNNTTETAYVSSFLDFTGDGDFDDGGEWPVEQAVAPGTHPVAFIYYVPVGAYSQPGALNVAHRVRISTRPNLAPTGFAPDGEVEDHIANLGAGGGFGEDWGDLPEPVYKTTAAAQGPFHTVLDALRLGSVSDQEPTESDGQPSAMADGDDVNGDDDEDGVSVVSGVVSGAPMTFSVLATNRIGSPAYVYAFVDWNKDGDFDEDGESQWQVIMSGKENEELLFTFDVPVTATAGVTGARFRISPMEDLDGTGDGWLGEVEDVIVFIDGQQIDWGDLPSPYATTQANNGPRHIVDPTIFIGSSPPDGESDGEESSGADADDVSGVDDEDESSIALPEEVLPDSEVVVMVNVTSMRAAKLYGWIDWNGDGIFNPETENSSVDVPVDSDADWLALPFITPSTLPENNLVAARFRISTNQNLQDTGEAPDGEVEDYIFPIGPPVYPEVGISANVSQILEAGGGVATITATLSAVTGVEVTVHLAFPVFGGGAELGSDYSMSSTQITIPAGQLTGSVTLTAIDDTVSEAWQEPAMVGIIFASEAIPIPSQSVVTVLINDDDNPVAKWLETQFGLSGFDATPTADPDEDGKTNVEEIALGGGNPTVPSGQLKILIASMADTNTGESHLHLCYQRIAGGAIVSGAYEANGIRYEPTGSSDLENWIEPVEPQPLPAGLPAPEPGFEWVCHRLVDSQIDIPRGFIRLSFSPGG